MTAPQYGFSANIPLADNLTRAVTDPSSPLNILEVPAPGTGGMGAITAEFWYNRHTPDEYENESGNFGELNLGSAALDIKYGDTPVHGDITDKENPGQSIINAVDYKAFLPRFVYFQFDPLSLISLELQDAEKPSKENEENYEELIRNNLDKLIDDSYFARAGNSKIPYASFLLQDINISQRTYRSLDVSAQLRASINTDGKPAGDTADEKSTALAALKSTIEQYDVMYEGSSLEKGITNFIGEIINDIEEGKNLSKLVPDDNETGSPYQGSYMLNKEDTLPFDRVVQNGLLCGMHVNQVLTRMASAGMSPYSLAVTSDIPFAKALQADSRAQNLTINSDWVVDEFAVTFPYMDDSDLLGSGGGVYLKGDGLNTSSTANPAWTITPRGYLIEKFGLEPLVDPSGNWVGDVWLRKESIVFGSPSHTAGIDTKVKCGYKYLYRPRTVAEVRLVAYDAGGGSPNAHTISAFILSRPGPAVVVNTKDSAWDIPPVNPRDLKFVWDYYNNEMTFHWSYPHDTAGDITYFKVFRRSSVYEPFQLQRLYDFNPYSAKYGVGYTDQIRSSLIKKTGKHPLTFYTDPEFNKDSTYIYCVMSGDISGKWSNLSAQYAVSFDKVRNRLNISLLSSENAPPHYPNWFLREDISTKLGEVNLTADRMATSGYDQMMIAFDPDARHLIKNPGSAEKDMQLFMVKSDHTSDPGLSEQKYHPYQEGRYIMSIANLDRHKVELLQLHINAVGHSQ